MHAGKYEDRHNHLLRIECMWVVSLTCRADANVKMPSLFMQLNGNYREKMYPKQCWIYTAVCKTDLSTLVTCLQWGCIRLAERACHYDWNPIQFSQHWLQNIPVLYDSKFPRWVFPALVILLDEPGISHSLWEGMGSICAVPAQPSPSISEKLNSLKIDDSRPPKDRPRKAL